ncbi:hypothetical protein [Pedobacter segetis]|uniref:hypothetical protein n=1 Tax=Pedobacter segetis TaxID=2793069 RepID=UPI00190AA66F|nr:hypothetical protein [Pedobacter segetis]
MKIELSPLLLRISEDQKLYPSHGFILIALFIVYQKQNYIMPFQISRRKLMALAKIHSIATYHKCIKELVNLGYILYEPSYPPLKRSEVFLTEQLIG